MMGDAPVLASIKNPLKRPQSIACIDALLVETAGTDLENTPTDFRLIFDEWFFDNISVFQISLAEIEKSGSSMILEILKNLSKQSKHGIEPV
jgi:hypothetical protein